MKGTETELPLAIKDLKIVCLDGEAMVRYSDVMEVFIM